ncbi:hypothetical protein B0H17DRAFT_1149339 [Mycena rosella]|uniref:Uncharacterized protein n=1 Tax=Mycena rosella TaxID=1033263 RepID=A0AAD7FU89_MYCRO|nr:hypothetical protein B0H17DRAFT_1149339 [Mycena rosella]
MSRFLAFAPSRITVKIRNYEVRRFIELNLVSHSLVPALLHFSQQSRSLGNHLGSTSDSTSLVASTSLTKVPWISVSVKAEDRSHQTIFYSVATPEEPTDFMQTPNASATMYDYRDAGDMDCHQVMYSAHPKDCILRNRGPLARSSLGTVHFLNIIRSLKIPQLAVKFLRTFDSALSGVTKKRGVSSEYENGGMLRKNKRIELTEPVKRDARPHRSVVRPQRVRAAVRGAVLHMVEPRSVVVSVPEAGWDGRPLDRCGGGEFVGRSNAPTSSSQSAGTRPITTSATNTLQINPVTNNLVVKLSDASVNITYKRTKRNNDDVRRTARAARAAAAACGPRWPVPTDAAEPPPRPRNKKGCYAMSQSIMQA